MNKKSNQRSKVNLNTKMEILAARVYSATIENEAIESDEYEWIFEDIAESPDDIFEIKHTITVWAKTIIDISQIERITLTLKPNIYDVTFTDGFSMKIKSDDIYNNYLTYRSFYVPLN